MDRKPHLNQKGIKYLCNWTEKTFIVTDNKKHYVHIVIAPLLVGGADTSTLIDGKAITQVEELNKLKALKLIECNVLEDSYIQLKYEVIK